MFEVWKNLINIAEIGWNLVKITGNFFNNSFVRKYYETRIFQNVEKFVYITEKFLKKKQKLKKL